VREIGTLVRWATLNLILHTPYQVADVVLCVFPVFGSIAVEGPIMVVYYGPYIGFQRAPLYSRISLSPFPTTVLSPWRQGPGSEPV